MNRILSTFFKTHSIYRYIIPKNVDKNVLGRWKLNDNIEKKIDLANLDNCGDRLCGTPTENFTTSLDTIDKYEKIHTERLKK